MITLRVLLGWLIDRCVGRRSFHVTMGTKECIQQSIQPDWSTVDLEMEICSQEYIHTCTYDRWWPVVKRRAVYEVVGRAPAELMERLDARLFIPVTYPHLCNNLLKSTSAAHMYAINAYLDRLSRYVKVRM